MALKGPSKYADRRSTEELLDVLAPLLPAEVVTLASSIEGQQEVLEHLATMIASTRGTVARLLEGAVSIEVKNLEVIWNRVSKGKKLKDHDEARQAIREFVFQAMSRDEFQSLNRPMMEDPVTVRVGGKTRTVRLRELLQSVPQVAGADNLEETRDELQINAPAVNAFIAPPILNPRQWEEFATELYSQLGRPANRQLASFVLPATLTDSTRYPDEYSLLRGVCTAKDQRLLYFALQYLSKDETLIDEVRPAGLTADQLRVRKGIVEGLHHLEHFGSLPGASAKSYAQLTADKVTVEGQYAREEKAYDTAVSAKDSALATAAGRRMDKFEKELKEIETLLGQLEERRDALKHVLHELHEAGVDLKKLGSLKDLYTETHLKGKHEINVNLPNLTTKTDFKAIAAEVREHFADSKEGALKESKEYTELMKSVKKQKGVEGNAACLRIIDKAVRNKMESESQPEGRIEQVIALNRKRLMESAEANEQRQELAEHDLPDPVSEWEARREFDAERPVPESAVDGAVTMAVGGVVTSAALSPASELLWNNVLSFELSTYLSTIGITAATTAAGWGVGEMVGRDLSNDIDDPEMSEFVRANAGKTGAAVGVLTGITALQAPGVFYGLAVLGLPLAGTVLGYAIAKGFGEWMSSRIGAKFTAYAKVLTTLGGTALGSAFAVGTPAVPLWLTTVPATPGIVPIMAPAVLTLVALYLSVRGASALTDLSTPFLKSLGLSDGAIKNVKTFLQVVFGGTAVWATSFVTGGVDLVLGTIGVAGAAVYRYFFPSRSAYLEYEKNVLEEIGISESDTFEQGKFDVEEVKHKYFELRFMTEYEPPEKDDPKHPGCLKPTPALVKLMQKMQGALVLHAANELAENVSADMAASAGVHADMGKYQEAANAALESEYAEFASSEGPASAEHIAHRAYKEIEQLQKSKKTRDSVLGSMWGGVKDFFYEVYTGKKPKPKEKK